MSPTLRANSFPKVTNLICRLPLSTLFCQPEAVHLVDLLRLWVRSGARMTLPPDFQGTLQAHRTRQKCRALLAGEPYLRTIRFQGPLAIKKKRKLFPEPTPSSPGSVALPRRNPPPDAGILTSFPFAVVDDKHPYSTELPYSLGSANPRPTAVHVEPFPTSVLQDPTEVFATTTKICTRDSSTRAHALRFPTISTAAYTAPRHTAAPGRYG